MEAELLDFCAEPNSANEFTVKTRAFFFTYSNLGDLTLEEALTSFVDFMKLYSKSRRSAKCIYYIVCSELHQNGITHVHVILVFNSEVQITVNNQVYIKGHRPQLYKVRNLTAAVKYCKKTPLFVEEPKFENTELAKFKGRNRSRHLPECRDDLDAKVRENRFKNFQYLYKSSPLELVRDGIITFNNLCIFKKNLEYAKYIMQGDIPQTRPMKAIWLYGPTGIGKSHYVRNAAKGSLYTKDAKNHWWCGYDGQKVVLIEEGQDFASDQYLKIWADKFSFIGEIKGGSRTIFEYEKLYITSNYLPARAVKYKDTVDNKESFDALCARFTIATIFNGNGRLVTYDPKDKVKYERIVVASLVELNETRERLERENKVAWVQFIPKLQSKTGIEIIDD